MQVFPTDGYDRLTYAGYRTDVWLDPSFGAAQLPDRVAHAYRDGQPAGEVCLVIGGGDLSSVQPLDVLHQLFAENRVVVLKCSPVQEHVGPILEDVFRPLVNAGALRVVYGGAEVGQRLAHHPLVDRLHMTGSDKTYDALVWGSGDESERRKAENRPVLDKPFTAELGAVTPLIVVPGPWSSGDLAFHGENAISMTVFNAGHICVSTRLLVTHRQWAQRPAFLESVRTALRAAPAFPAYYPGAADRHAGYLERYPHAERFGEPQGRCLPYLFVPDLTRDADESALVCDPFCGVLAEVPLDAEDPARFLDRAVELCNDRVWGSLGITLLVHPRTLHDRATAVAFERALADLQYGNINVNAASGIGYAIVSPPWGAYPGNSPRDIGSGTGFVHNTYLLDDAQKAVTRAPWRPRPKPPWFPTHRQPQEVTRRLAHLEAAPSPLKVPGLFRAALGG
ncbi:MAG: aldehyde dehydrogenase family protein [Mycobacterium leprae]